MTLADWKYTKRGNKANLVKVEIEAGLRVGVLTRPSFQQKGSNAAPWN